MGARVSTKEVLFNILKCLVIFYALYYVSGSVFFAVYRLRIFDGRIPFDFKTWLDLSQCCIGYTSQQMVHLISMELTYLFSGLVYGFVASSWVWDYAFTVTVIHILLCCTVMLDFPMNWSWWVCLGGGLLVQIGLGEFIAFIRRRKKSAQVAISPDQEPTSFLYRKL